MPNTYACLAPLTFMTTKSFLCNLCNMNTQQAMYISQIHAKGQSFLKVLEMEILCYIMMLDNIVTDQKSVPPPKQNRSDCIPICPARQLFVGSRNDSTEQ